MKQNTNLKKYNGHRSWNAWNVSLWLNNDYALYKRIEESLAKMGLEKTINIITHELEGLKTQDGAIYNRLSIKEAIIGMTNE
tara:strand:+ start:1338 stop:1583 length:246 start_codon:yes stop_codon:yes gene_type:complete